MTSPAKPSNIEWLIPENAALNLGSLVAKHSLNELILNEEQTDQTALKPQPTRPFLFQYNEKHNQDREVCDTRQEREEALIIID